MSPDRIIACILGGAIGDGWGRPFEGRPRPARLDIPDKLFVSDDTQMTLATCEAVLESGNVDPERIAARFVVWFRARRITGMGSSTLKALRDLDLGAHWALSGAKGERAAGNGAAMRVAPLAFLLDPGNQDDRRTLRDVCRITHHHDEAYIGGLAVVVAIRLACEAEYDLAHLLADVGRHLPDSQVRDRIEQLTSLSSEMTPAQVAERFGSSGFVVESVPLAILAASEIRRKPLVSVIGDAILAGGDTDTIASMAGQIAGAAAGTAGLPGELLTRLAEGKEITDIAQAFSAVGEAA